MIRLLYISHIIISNYIFQFKLEKKIEIKDREKRSIYLHKKYLYQNFNKNSSNSLFNTIAFSYENIEILFFKYEKNLRELSS